MRLSIRWTSLRLSRSSRSVSVLCLWISSLASRIVSFFFASAAAMASLTILFASFSAEPMAASAILFLCKPPSIKNTTAPTAKAAAAIRITNQVSIVHSSFSLFCFAPCSGRQIKILIKKSIHGVTGAGTPELGTK